MPNAFTYILATRLPRGVLTLLIALAASAACTLTASSQQQGVVYFPINSDRVLPQFSLNPHTLPQLLQRIRAVHPDSLPRMRYGVAAYASPDGRTPFNLRLIERRRNAMVRLLADSCGIPMENILINPTEIPVSGVISYLADKRPEYAESVLPILREIDTTSGRSIERGMERLRRLDGGRIWRRMAQDVLPNFRYGEIIFPATPARTITHHPLSLSSQTSACEYSASLPLSLTAMSPQPQGSIINRMQSATHSLTLGTNLLEGAFAIANLFADYRWTPRFSSLISLHYSCWDYGTETRKFRLAAVATEFRWWLKPATDGIFTALNLGTGIYNVMWDNIRWQDPKGGLPAIGAGAKVGYRCQLFNSRRWKLELSAGLAAYYLRFDEYRNVHNGPQFDKGETIKLIPNGFGMSLAYQIPM